MTDDMDARARVKRLEQEVADRDEEIAALIDAQADTREARDNAEQRAQRAEAECERLRESIQKYADHVCEGWCATNGGQGKFKDCQGCQIHDIATPHAPEQAHGDARSRAVEDTDNLELLREIENSEGDGTEEALTPYGAKCIADELEQLRTLTASGVPYVPENIRQLVDTWRTHAEKEIVAPTTGRWMARKCADDLAGAIASAPAVCEWTCQGPDAYGHEQFRGQCGANWWCVEGYGPELIRDGHPYCHGCGRRIQVAAAPQRGK